jgi:membrane protease YdiL (CAAX protease family)
MLGSKERVVTTGVPPGLPPRLTPTPPAERARSILRPAVTFYGVVTLFAIGLATFSGNVHTLLGDTAPNVVWLLVGVGAGLGVVAVCHAMRKTVKAIDRAADLLIDVLGPLSTETAVILALVSGVAEELLFRGALWPFAGLVGTTFLFAIVHVVPRRGLIGYPLFAGAVGLLLGVLRGASGSVLPPILAHATVNALNLVWLERRRRERGLPTSAA